MPEENEKTLDKVSFWKMFASQPCVRETYLYSFTGGLIVGALNFMFTSDVRKSQYRGLLTISSVMGCYWVYCRYSYFKEQKRIDEVSKRLQETVMKIGVDPNVKLLPDDTTR